MESRETGAEAMGPQTQKPSSSTLAKPTSETHAASPVQIAAAAGVSMARSIATFVKRDEIRDAIRWLALLILPIIVSAVSAYAISKYIPPVYAARTDLILHLQQSGDAVERYLANQAVIIKSPAVLSPVSENSGISMELLDKQLSIEFPKGGSVMRIQVANQNRDIALDLTRKILAQYELVISQSEENESASHQVLSPPALLQRAVAPQSLQLTAIGGAIGLMISLAALGLIRLLRSRP